MRKVGVTPNNDVITAPTGPEQKALTAELSKRARLSVTFLVSQAVPVGDVFRCHGYGGLIQTE